MHGHGDGAHGQGAPWTCWTRQGAPGDLWPGQGAPGALRAGQGAPVTHVAHLVFREVSQR